MANESLSVPVRPYLLILAASITICIVFLALKYRGNSTEEISDPYGSNVHEALTPAGQEAIPPDNSDAPNSRPVVETSNDDEREDFRAMINNAIASIPIENDPFGKYQSNISAAQNGDADSQYRVSRALQQCSITPRDEQLDEILAGDRFDGDAKNMLLQQNQTCSKLFELVGSDEMAAGSNGWLHMAAEQGHPLAQLRVFLSTGFDPLVDKNQLFVDSFKRKSNDIYGMMLIYHSIHKDADETEMYAWNALACQVNPACPTAEVIDAIFDGKPQYYSETVARRVAEIRQSIEHENWDAIIPKY